jgi:hypothetical protein
MRSFTSSTHHPPKKRTRERAGEATPGAEETQPMKTKPMARTLLLAAGLGLAGGPLAAVDYVLTVVYYME